MKKAVLALDKSSRAIVFDHDGRTRAIARREFTWHYPKAGGPVHPTIVWQDRLTAATCDPLRATGVESVFRKRTGLLLQLQADPPADAGHPAGKHRDHSLWRRVPRRTCRGFLARPRRIGRALACGTYIPSRTARRRDAIGHAPAGARRGPQPRLGARRLMTRERVVLATASTPFIDARVPSTHAATRAKCNNRKELVNAPRKTNESVR